MSNYNDIAFNATKVPSLAQGNIFHAEMKYYSVINSVVTEYNSELEAMESLLSSIDLSKYYKFVTVFYNPTGKTGKNDKKYADFVMVMARKTVAVNNNILNYLIASSSNSGTIAENVSETDNFATVRKNLENVKGLGLSLLASIETTKNEVTTYDIKDNFIYGEYTNEGNAITCNILFDELKKLANMVENNVINLTLIDITGLPLKTTIDNEDIVIDDALDIYREFVGGTDSKMEDLDSESTPPIIPNPDEAEKLPANDSDYIN